MKNLSYVLFIFPFEIVFRFYDSIILNAHNEVTISHIIALAIMLYLTTFVRKALVFVVSLGD